MGSIPVCEPVIAGDQGFNGNPAVLHATYYASSPKHPPAKKSDLIVPLSTLLNNTGNQASVPPGFSVSRFEPAGSRKFLKFLIFPTKINVTLPQNTVQVYAELYASGNGNEEFWVCLVFLEHLLYNPSDRRCDF